MAAMGKRDAILNAAVHLFTEKGFQGTTTAEISRTAGVATGTLFNYFPSKTELINQLFLHCKESMAAALHVEASEQGEYRETFRILWERGIRWALENPEMRWFFTQFASSPYSVDMRRREGGAVRFEFIVSFLERGVEENLLRDIPLDLLYSFVLSATSGVIEELLFSDADADMYIQTTFEMVWAGMAR